MYSTVKMCISILYCTEEHMRALCGIETEERVSLVPKTNTLYHWNIIR